jgi:hypothetical protein
MLYALTIVAEVTENIVKCLLELLIVVMITDSYVCCFYEYCEPNSRSSDSQDY